MASSLKEQRYLYWARDFAGDLLYIGITNDFARRKSEHARKSKWYRLASKWSVDELPTGAHARVAEAALIALRRPRFNIVHKAGQAKPQGLVRIFVKPWMASGNGLQRLVDLLNAYPGDEPVALLDGSMAEVPIGGITVCASNEFARELVAYLGTPTSTRRVA